MTIEPYVFSFSELDDLRQCPYKHQLRWTERWTPPTASPAQERGTRWHQLMATFYGHRIGPDRVGPRTAAVRTIDEHLSDSSDETELLYWMFEGYVEHWGHNRDWIVRAVEFQMTVPLFHSIHLKVRSDLIVRLRDDPKKRLWLVDSKTSSRLANQLELALHVQFPLYTWALRRAGIPIWGTIYDNVRTQRNKVTPQALEDRFARTLVHYNDDQLEAIAQDAWKDMAQTRTLVRPSSETTPPEQPRHFDPERCRYRCPFTEACIAGVRGGDTRRFLKDLGFRRDPTRH